MLFKFVQVDIGRSPSFPWTVEVAVDDRESESLVCSINKCRGLKLTSADLDLKATISIPLFDGYVLVIDSHRGLGSPVYVYCIQVPHLDDTDSIEEEEIIKKIEKCLPPLPHDRPVYWRVKPVDNEDEEHHAKAKGSQIDILLPLTSPLPSPSPPTNPLGAVSYFRGAVLFLCEDRDGGNCHTTSGDGILPHPESIAEQGGSEDLSVAKQRDVHTNVPHGTLKSDEGVVDHKGSDEVTVPFIERISHKSDVPKNIEPSSDCPVNDEEEDNPLESSSEDDEERIASFHCSHPVVSFNRSRSFPSDNGRISRTPSDTSLPNSNKSNEVEGGGVPLLIEKQVEGGCNEDISPLIVAVKAIDISDNGVPGGQDAPVMKAGTSPSSSLPSSTASTSATGDSNEASTEEKVWSENAELRSEENSPPFSAVGSIRDTLKSTTPKTPALLPAQLVAEEGTVSGAPLVEEESGTPLAKEESGTPGEEQWQNATPLSTSSSDTSDEEVSAKGCGSVSVDSLPAFDSRTPETSENVIMPAQLVVEEGTVSGAPLVKEGAVSGTPLVEEGTVSETPLVEEDTAPTDQLVEEVDVSEPPTDSSNEERNPFQEINGEHHSEEKVFVGTPSPVNCQCPGDLVSVRPYFPHYLYGFFPSLESLSRCPPGSVLYATTEEIYNIDVSAEYRRIGKGGYGKIYRYKDKYALKMTHYRKEELDIYRELNHSNIVPLLGVILINPKAGLIYQVMPLMSCDLRKDLGTVCLRDISAIEKPLFLNHVVPNMRHLFWNILKPLIYLHGKGITHADIKPGNILLKRPEMCRCPNILECVCLQKFGVCLADFNTVSRRDCASLIYEIPQSLQGTVPYMSPQACRGYRPAPTDDSWGLGIMLYHCCLGTEYKNVPDANMLLRRDLCTRLDMDSAPIHAMLLPNDLSQAALKDRDLEMFATFVCHCLVIDDHQRWTAKELIKECLSWGNSSQDI